MSSLKYYTPPKFNADGAGYNEAVVVGDQIYMSGQGGFGKDLKIDEDLETEFMQALDNVGKVIQHTIKNHSGEDIENGWSKVFKVTSYHVGLPANYEKIVEWLIREIKVRAPHEPTWTVIGVESLAFPNMRVEVDAIALSK